MASFCMKCGAALEAADKFCKGCGTPVAAVGATGSAAAPAAPAPAKSGSGLKIVLIVVGVIAGLVVLSVVSVLFFAYRVARNVKVDESKGTVSISTPQGTIKVGEKVQVTEAELGVPLYPGATQQEGSMQITTEEGAMGTYVFLTDDAPSKVMAFYKEKLGTKAATFIESEEGGMITTAKEEGKEEPEHGFMITVGRDTDKSKTTIAIIRGSKKAPK